mmetsp:Transcript_21892/g.30605  ORF Transcript_21892/g.30605 Transcript_21892/m.30605 type:complete len:101 (+) Transcript_21892:204-506(+)
MHKVSSYQIQKFSIRLLMMIIWIKQLNKHLKRTLNTELLQRETSMLFCVIKMSILHKKNKRNRNPNRGETCKILSEQFNRYIFDHDKPKSYYFYPQLWLQ